MVRSSLFSASSARLSTPYSGKVHHPVRSGKFEEMSAGAIRPVGDFPWKQPRFQTGIVRARADLIGSSAMQRTMVFTLTSAILAALLSSAQTRPSRALDIYVIDVEGGNATLFVSPTGESLLMDTGNAGPAAARDAARIVDAIHEAGLRQIDHLITTHWHGDHFGGMAELAQKVPIREFIDHGPNVQPGQGADDFLTNTYPKLYASAKHTVAKPGDIIPLGAVTARVVTSAGEMFKTPLPGSGPNPYCAQFKAAENNAEDP